MSLYISKHSSNLLNNITHLFIEINHDFKKETFTIEEKDLYISLHMIQIMVPIKTLPSHDGDMN